MGGSMSSYLDAKGNEATPALSDDVVELVTKFLTGGGDPHEFFAEFRTRAPRLRLPDGTYVLFRRADVVRVLRDHRVGHMFEERQRRLWGDEVFASSRMLQSKQHMMFFMD